MSFFSSLIERRTTARRSISRPAWIDSEDGHTRLPCRIVDISEGGARLVLPEARDLPGNFSLVLLQDGSDTKRCRMAWRSGETVGVEFLGISHYLIP